MEAAEITLNVSTHTTEPAKQSTIASLILEDGQVVRRKPEIEQERAVALGDLLRSNSFTVLDFPNNPYDVVLSVEDNRLHFSITSGDIAEALIIKLAIAPFRSIIRDYFMICESYFEAIKMADPYKVEAVDMGRRGIHNEGSELLQSLLSDKVVMDFDTARRIFTLMCVLHIK